MRKIGLLLGVLFMVQMAGCQQNNKKVQVLVDEGGFPQFLVGEWVGQAELAEGQEWKVTFMSDGEISAVTMPLGKVELKPGQVTKFKTWGEGKGIYEPGKWIVEYSTKSRQLAVTIEVRHFYQDLGPNALEGGVTDILVGEVSADGQKWTADWIGFPKYTVINAKREKQEIVTDPNGELRGKVYFEKVKTQKAKGKE